MRALIIAGLLLTVSTAACKRAEKPVAPGPNPIALQESSYPALTSSSRSYQDLVDELYEERVGSSKALQDLERAIVTVRAAARDSTGAYVSYDGKNQSYYDAAERHASQMTDSALKRSVLAMMANSQGRYDSSMSAYRLLLEAIQAKNLRLNDLHILLKVSQTLPMIEAFQRNARPDARPMRAHLQHLEKVILQAQQPVAK